MKNKIIIIFLFTLLIPLYFAHAALCIRTPDENGVYPPWPENCVNNPNRTLPPAETTAEPVPSYIPIAPTVPAVKKIPLTPDQICIDNFGSSWKWEGTVNSAGSLNCDCQKGYVPENNSCVPAPTVAPLPKAEKKIATPLTIKVPVQLQEEKKVTPGVGKVQMKKEVPIEIKSETSPVPDLYATTSSGIVATSSEKARRVSFWKRFMGLFGF